MLLLPFDLSLSDTHKNYKPYYNSRLDSIFGSKLPIRSSLEGVFDCGFTESLIVTTFINPLRNKYIIQTIRDYIISTTIIFSKWILKFSLYFSSGFLLCYIFCLHYVNFLLYIYYHETKSF